MWQMSLLCPPRGQTEQESMGRAQAGSEGTAGWRPSSTQPVTCTEPAPSASRPPGHVPGEMKKVLHSFLSRVTSRISRVMLTILPATGGTRRKSRILQEGHGGLSVPVAAPGAPREYVCLCLGPWGPPGLQKTLRYHQPGCRHAVGPGHTHTHTHAGAPENWRGGILWTLWMIPKPGPRIAPGGTDRPSHMALHWPPVQLPAARGHVEPRGTHMRRRLPLGQVTP